MSSSKPAAHWPHCDLPPSLKVVQHDEVAVLTLSRVEKRNALDLTTVAGFGDFFDSLPESIKAVVINGDGAHFSAGLDLSEVKEQDATQGVMHSRKWHKAFSKIEFGPVPVVSVLHGAVVGGGLELACSTHIRVAERSAYYALPEGIRGIFVGGGGSVRLSKLIGASRMQEMMMTGRILSADDGHTYGITHYVVDEGAGLEKGIALAKRAAQNAPMTNFALIHALPRIADADPETGLLMEALVSSIAAADGEAKKRLRDFLEKRGAKVVKD